MKRFLVAIVFASAIFGSGSPGIRPRAAATDYPAHETASDITIGAAVIPSAEVKKIFATDISKGGYVVIEVGVFPETGKEVDLSPMDFTLSVDPNSIAERPADADAIAAALDKKQHPQSPSRMPGDIYPSAGASIGHGTWTDPVTGRRTSGTVTQTGAGVGVGAPAPLPCSGINCDDRMPMPAPPVHSTSQVGQMEQELWQRALPDGRTTQAVAGYLYFPKPSGKSKTASWVLRWDNAGRRLKVDLNNARAR